MIPYAQDRGLTFAVRVVPRASRSEIAGEHNGALRVRIAAPPVAGAANRELVRTLAKIFKLPQNAVEIVSGANSKNKTVRLRGADAATLERLILSK
ncbi:MAG: YggU family protein [Acidobacteria bacterium]|nr:MAG: YggU family protein [Acidobacteriota bacterium]